MTVPATPDASLERAAEILARAALQGRKKPEEAAGELRFDPATRERASARFDTSRLSLLATALRKAAGGHASALTALAQAEWLLARLPAGAAERKALLPRIEELLRQADARLAALDPGHKAVFSP